MRRIVVKPEGVYIEKAVLDEQTDTLDENASIYRDSDISKLEYAGNSPSGKENRRERRRQELRKRKGRLC